MLPTVVKWHRKPLLLVHAEVVKNINTVVESVEISMFVRVRRRGGL